MSKWINLGIAGLITILGLGIHVNQVEAFSGDVLANDADYEQIHSMEQELLDATQNFNNVTPVKVCYDRASKIFVGTNIFENDTMTDSILNEVKSSANYVWEVPISLENGGCVVCTVGRKPPISEEWKRQLIEQGVQTEVEIQAAEQLVGTWVIPTGAYYESYIDYLDRASAVLKEPYAPDDETHVTFLGGTPGLRQPFVVFQKENKYQIALLDSRVGDGVVIGAEGKNKSVFEFEELKALIPEQKDTDSGLITGEGTVTTPKTDEKSKVQFPQKKSGWWKNANTWYYLDGKGSAKHGWLKDGGKWYYLDESGAMKTGWVQVAGQWYYMNQSGAMKTGWLKSGSWYYLTSSGAMKTGWLSDRGTWYYMDKNGAMKTGWVTVNDKKYYMNASGAMQTGLVNIDGEEYFFQSSGEMATGIIYDKASQKSYYLNDDGTRMGIRPFKHLTAGDLASVRVEATNGDSYTLSEDQITRLVNALQKVNVHDSVDRYAHENFYATGIVYDFILEETDGTVTYVMPAAPMLYINGIAYKELSSKMLTDFFDVTSGIVEELHG